MKRAPIRLRLTAWYGAVLLAALVLFGFGTWLALYQRLVAGVDTRLGQRAQGLRVALESEDEAKDRNQLVCDIGEIAQDYPDGTVIQLRDAAGRLVEWKPAQVVFPAKAGPTPRTVEAGGRTFRVLSSSLSFGDESYELLLATPLDEVRAVMHTLLLLLLAFIPAILAAASLGGYWLSRRALRPVDRITAAAQSISVQNLSMRLDVPPTGDELARMAATWNTVLERLEGSVNRIRQFTADASHELRSPLALIRGGAELALRRDRSPEEYRKFLLDIEREAARMTSLTESLLTLARSGDGGLIGTVQETDLGSLGASVVSQSRETAAARSIGLEAQTSAQPVVARADPAALRRVLLILLDNAFKHTPPGGHVTVTTNPVPDGVEVAVEDTGEGIAADALPHIFERFWRADPVRSRDGGFGLGLSIAQGIVQAHGSEIQVRSAPGAGARFWFVLQR